MVAAHDRTTRGGPDGLSHEDRSRASAIADPDERDRFYVGRRLLRHTLAERTGRRPGDLQIASGPNGQAFLLGGGPFFGLAHSDHWHAVTLCDELPVGVAVAPLAQAPALDGVVSALLPRRVRAEINAVPPTRRAETTLRWWLTTEAAVRACGASLDQAEDCLARVTAEVGRPLPGAMVAVAGRTARALHVRWRVLTPEQSGVPA